MCMDQVVAGIHPEFNLLIISLWMACLYVRFFPHSIWTLPHILRFITHHYVVILSCIVFVKRGHIFCFLCIYSACICLLTSDQSLHVYVCVCLYIYISKANWTQNVINGPLNLPQADKAEDSRMAANIFMIVKTATKKNLYTVWKCELNLWKGKYKNIIAYWTIYTLWKHNKCY